MRVIIAGSRHLTGVRLVYDAIRESGWFTQITEIVSGCAPGIDSEGQWWAHGQVIPVKRFQAEWRKYGAAAGPIRNRQMAEYADALILIWDGQSRGSADMKKKAQAKNLLIYEKVI